ncbi:hypothetical protein [Pseudobutyrivibrio sp.]|jgi:hypothetical protein|uniref:hypothetical protein n=1 Tax=Pseudobutyrivibrio sp. TaxID=2014367 RepID=UPI0025FEBF99|nr:hypothetical protein [Pseudobutyrivibrio sp.]
MTLILYNTTSPQRKINKTLTNAYTVTFSLKGDANVVSPVVLLKYISGIDRFNYAYIEEFHRYYWITDIHELIGGVTELTLRCDVLMTYKPDVLAANLSMIRKGKGGLSMIPDTNYPLYPYRDMKVIKFVPEVPVLTDTMDEYTKCFVLTVAGK